MLQADAAVLEEDVRLGVQVLVEGEPVDIQEFIRLLSIFLQLLVPAMMTVISIHQGALAARDGWIVFFNRFTIKIPRKETNKVTPGGFWIFLRVAPVLMLIFVGALIYGLTK